ncbi:MAG: tRNA (guanosine(46)-N7)-methyltransferase TrmB [Pirellulales bacterium]|nr:tRNA (guanosine(46)-N7)-methyltransferase TrmB [Pirellulales bacterium]
MSREVGFHSAYSKSLPVPRSPLKRPPSGLDLSSTLRTVEQLPQRLDSSSLFGNDKPLQIEVGSGKGLFLATASSALPEQNFLGIEIIAKYAAHSAGRLVKAGVDNALMVHGNAEPLFAERIPPQSLEAVHVYFPDPWWKKRHRKRRVVNQTSVAHFSQSLRPGGHLHFWTDVLDYFENTVEMIAEIAPELGVPIPEDETEAKHDLDYRTHFERRSRQHSIPVYRVCYEKSPTSNLVPAESDRHLP